MQYGKDKQKVRCSIQNEGSRGYRQRRGRNRAIMPRAANLALSSGKMGQKIQRWHPWGDGKQRERTGAASRETSGQGRRVDDADRSVKKNRSLETTEEKRKFVRSQWPQLGSIEAACKIIDLAVSTFYYHPKESAVEKAQQEAEIRDLIEKVQAEFPFYGYRRVHEYMERKYGITVNKKKLLGIMQKYGLKALIWRGFKVKTTDSKHSHGYAPNLLPGMSINGPNQVWVADITYIRVLTGFVYLAAILDLFSRKIVGWALSERIDANLCLEALKHAVITRRPQSGLIHHSDRGIQYACNEYQDYLRDHEIVPSMSAKGYCYDNAFMESWFKTLKAEEVYLTEYENYEDAKKRLPEFIEAVYNSKRIHSGISYLAPDEFEELWEKGMLTKMGIQPELNLPRNPSK